MDFPQLTSNIVVTHNALQSNAMRAINQNILLANRNQEIIQSLIEKFQITENENDRIFQSLIGKLPIPKNSIFQTVSGKFDPDWHSALHRRIFRDGALRHGWHGRKLVHLQVFAPTACQRNIC